MRRVSRTHIQVACAAMTAIALAPVLSACGGSSSSSSVASNTTMSVQTSAMTATAATPITTLPINTTPTTTSAAPPPSTSTTTIINTQASMTQLIFSPATLSAPAGKVVIRMANPSPIPHGIALDIPGVASGAIVGQGGVSEVTATLTPGTYTFYCPVPGHRQAGMVGTLTVH